MTSKHPVPSTMRAWQCKEYCHNTSRAAKEISLAGSLPVPSPGSYHVLVHVHFAAVDPMDWNLITGVYKDRFPVKHFPFVPGFDAAGEVVALGPDCSTFKAGDKVLMGLGLAESFSETADFGPAGAFAEYCVCPESQMFKLPASVDLSVFAGLPMSGLTAYQALFTGNGSSTTGQPLGNVGPGSQVLVLGGDRGVGHLAVQMAKLRGATVVATASPNKLAWVEAIGAAQTINYKQEAWTQQLVSEGKEGSFDLLLDLVGWATSCEEVVRATKFLCPQGQYISVANNAEALEAVEAADTQASCACKSMLATCNSEDLDQLVQWVAEGNLKVYVDRTYPFSEARHALHHSILSQSSGKVLLCQCSASSGHWHATTLGASGGA
ncbi:unnamed protein product [Polarella glacialis]|uniref:Enoyl reductase (ER) domain-containing protein n=1 Tax=Polarella glacialis TaxID=89957 RepID=A0A813KR92_POLGL|nr:unnamed protein product [Polarella glacialis]CAE8713915.1 unnamed protein product [Polarella glacialis]